MPLPSCGSGGVGMTSTSTTTNIAAPSAPSDTCSPEKNLKLHAHRVWNMFIPLTLILLLIEFVFMMWGISSKQASIGNASRILGSLKPIMPLITPTTK